MGVVVVILLVAGYGVWWIISRRWFPYGRCRLCGGGKQQPGSNRARFGPCRRCGGTGRRLRWGAREPDKRG